MFGERLGLAPLRAFENLASQHRQAFATDLVPPVDEVRALTGQSYTGWIILVC